MLNLSTPRIALIVLAAGLLVGAAGGGWLGWKLTAGARAAEDNARLQAQAREWAGIAGELRTVSIDQAAAMQAAIGRLNAISQGREDDRAALREFVGELAADLEQLRAGNPALRDVDLGADFLRHWNRANAGPGGSAEPAAAGTPGQPGAAMPAAAAGDGQHGTGDSGAARPGSGAVSRLPLGQLLADPVRAGMARHGLGLVLPGSDTHGRWHGHTPGQLPGEVRLRWKP